MKKKILMPMVLIAIQTTLYADADDDIFNILETSVNESFIKVVAKNRAASAEGGASSYTQISTKEEFLDALEKEKLNQPIHNGSNFKKEYVYTEIDNVHINSNDLKDVEGDTLRLGTDVKEGDVTQVLNIKNTKIETDKNIDMTVHLDASERNSATSVTNIEGSQLLGGGSSLSDNELANEPMIDANDGLLPFD